MNKTEIVQCLNKVRDAQKVWTNARATYNADATLIMRRLVMEGACAYMSTDDMAEASGMSEREVRRLLRNEGLDPRQKKPQLAKHSARILSDNAALLGIEPTEMDLMSPLAYLPAGSVLRSEVDAVRVSKVTEVETVETVEDAARTLLDAIRANWSGLTSAAVLSDAMCRLDDALGNPEARNYPPTPGQA